MKFSQQSLNALYAPTALPKQTERYQSAYEKFKSLYNQPKSDQTYFFSVPGRSELSGNHTDHNHGCVIAASISLDMMAVVSPREDQIVRLYSEGMGTITADITNPQPEKAQYGTSESLICGMAAAFAEKGISTHGFDAYLTSDVFQGSGLSSSAAFEVMIGTIFNQLDAHQQFTAVEIAQMAQYAENVFFGKPCGLMDQVACAHGGIVAIDFEDSKKPIVTPIPFSVTDAGYALCITNTGGNHVNLTPDYAAIPAEMFSVAKALGKNYLREVDPTDFYRQLPTLKQQVPNRALLRAIHFFNENERVSAQKQALLDNDFPSFLKYVKESGQSSFCYLQNIFPTEYPQEQQMSLALAATEHLLSSVKEPIAFRVHGGGFAGTIQAYVPLSQANEYCHAMNLLFGEGACSALLIRSVGAVCLGCLEDE